jgi:hypothetical protein
VGLFNKKGLPTGKPFLKIFSFNAKKITAYPEIGFYRDGRDVILQRSLFLFLFFTMISIKTKN